MNMKDYYNFVGCFFLSSVGVTNLFVFKNRRDKIILDMEERWGSKGGITL